MDIMTIIKERHSVRQYLRKSIEQEKREILNQLAKECNLESGLNIQMVYDDETCFSALFSKLMSFKDCTNYIAIIGKKDDINLEEKAGYYGEKIVLKAQEIGLNTCWVALTHGKSKAVVNEDEKQVIIIALGYGKTQGKPKKSKTREDVSKSKENLPEWYVLGVEAALLAPTGVNQQKFHIELIGDEAKITADNKATMTKIDLGIVKYHFEVASNHKCL